MNEVDRLKIQLKNQKNRYEDKISKLEFDIRLIKTIMNDPIIKTAEAYYLFAFHDIELTKIDWANGNHLKQK